MTRLRLLLTTVTAAVAVTVSAAVVVAVDTATAPPAHAETTANDVLLIHGISGPTLLAGGGGTVTSGCAGTFGTIIDELTAKGWPASSLRTIGYYRDDGNTSADANCDVNFATGSTLHPAHQSVCDTTAMHFDAASDGTNNQDIRNIACNLAWWIWNTYTRYNRSVRIVAHSMGGIIARYALSKVGTAGFPVAVYVSAVVTLGTPHDGANVPSIVQGMACGNCTQGLQLMKLDGAEFFNDMANTPVQPPTGSAEFRTGSAYTSWRTSWIVVGSECDMIVDDASAVSMAAGSGSYATVKYVYRMYDEKSCLSDSDAWNPDAGHGNYLKQITGSFRAQSCWGCDALPAVYDYEYGPVRVTSLWLTRLDTPAPGPAPTWPLVNPGFESGDAGWKVIPGGNGAGASMTEQWASPHGGAWYRAHYKTTAYTVTTEAVFTVPTREGYTASAWFSGCGSGHTMRLIERIGTTDLVLRQAATPCVSSGWGRLQLDAVTLVPEGVYAVQVESIAGPGAWVRFDDVQIARVSTYPVNVYGPGGGGYFATHGTWYGPDGKGLVGQMLWTGANGATEDSWAEWRPPVGTNTWYTVEAYIPDNHANAHAHYVVTDGTGVEEVVVNQAVIANGWAPLGVFWSGPGGRIVVHLSDRGDVYPPYLVGADAMRFRPTDPCNGQPAC